MFLKLGSVSRSGEGEGRCRSAESAERGRVINGAGVAAIRRGQDKRPLPLLCVYLTAKIPSIRDKTTVVAAITPRFNSHKSNYSFFFIRGAKSTKPDQFINAVKADRCGSRAHRREGPGTAPWTGPLCPGEAAGVG